MRHQGGHVALMLSLSIVVAVTVVGAGAVAIGIADTRRVAHEQRRQEALATAESALDRAALRLHLDPSRIRGVEAGDWMEPGHERWQVCDGRAPCVAVDAGNVESFDARWSVYGPLPDLFAAQESAAPHTTTYYLARNERPGEASPGWSTIHILAEGRSADGAGRARVRRSFQLRPLLRRIPAAPVELTDAAHIAGGFSVVAEDGVPAQSILQGIDALRLLFGTTDAQPLKGQAQVLDDCTSLGADSHGLLWIAGECVVSIAGAIGSREAPVVVVVESGAVHFDAPAEFFGILLLRSPTSGATALQQTNGPSMLHGALVADRVLNLAAENLTVRYDPALLQKLLQLGAQLSEVAGSWTDHR